MRVDKSLDAKNALSASLIRSSLRQEVVRRMTNMHQNIDLTEKVKVLDEFYVKLANSGHSHGEIRQICIEGLL